MTRKIVHKTGASPEKLAWEHDLVTEYACGPLGTASQVITSPKGEKEAVVASFDENGNIRARIYPNGYRIDFKYDGLNRLTRIFRPAAHGGRSTKRLEYDLRGNKLQEIEADGSTKTWKYDGLNRATRETFVSGGPQASQTTRIHEYAFNRVGSQTKGVDDDGNPYSMEYDGLQRATKSLYKGGSSAQFTYGKNSGSTMFESSSFNDTSSKASDGSARETHYDANGRRTSLLLSGAMGLFPKLTEYQYDAAGNLVVEIDSNRRRTTHEYDALNRRIKTTFPDGRSERTLYSSTGLKYATISAEGVRTEQTFDAAGEPIPSK